MKKKKTKKSQSSYRISAPPSAPTLDALVPRLKYRELIHVLQKEPFFARRIHEVVKYGRKNAAAEKDALKEIAKVLEPLTVEQWEELGVKTPPSDKCTNNTTFFMLDFCRYA